MAFPGPPYPVSLDSSLASVPFLELDKDTQQLIEDYWVSVGYTKTAVRSAAKDPDYEVPEPKGVSQPGPADT